MRAADRSGMTSNGRAHGRCKLVTFKRDPIMSQHHHHIGYARVRECMQGVQGDDLRKTIESLANARFSSQSNADTFAGACRALLDVATALELGGLHVIDDGGAYAAYLQQSPAAREVALGLAVANKNETAGLELALSALCGLAQGHRALVAWEAAKAPEQSPATPIEVRVVAMPDRRSETTVERDARDNIEKTIRIECDVE